LTKSKHSPQSLSSSTSLLSSTTTCRHFLTKQIYYNGTYDTFIKICRSEGLLSLWSGLTPALFVSIPTVVIYFTSYMKAKELLGYNERKPNPLLPVIAGVCSRVFAVTSVSPFELIRTKMQSERFHYKQIFRIISLSISEEGPRVLWKGLLPTLWRDIPFSMIYWLNYESFRAYLVKSNVKVDAYWTFICGAASGTIAASLTTPCDVVKTYRQIELGRNSRPFQNVCNDCTDSSIKTTTTTTVNNNIANRQTVKTWTILLRIVNTQGVKGLFAGLVPRVLKVAPACAIMITSFETLRTFFQNRNSRI